MKKIFGFLFLLSIFSSAHAQDVAADTAFADDFMNHRMPAMTRETGFGAFDTPTDRSTVNLGTINYRGSLSTLGQQAMDRCKNYVPTGNVALDQECAGVNYMANNCLQPSMGQQQIVSGAANVPLASNNCLGTFGASAGNFSLSPADKLLIQTNSQRVTTAITTDPQICTPVQKTVKPSVRKDFNCTQNLSYTEVSCTQDLLVQCGLVAAPLRSYSTNRGSCGQAAITPTGTPGIYDYVIYCGGWYAIQSASITFELPNLSWNPVITMEISNLDDAAAVGINGTTIYAGHPNSGPQYFPDFFPRTRQDFVMGYTWQEDTQQGCSQWQWDSFLNQMVCAVPYITRTTKSAAAKLLDYCPSPYATGDYTGYDIGCNTEGKLLMGASEGGYAVSSVMPSTAFPLVNGTNKIEVVWGTTSGGSVTVRGQIQNYEPQCYRSGWRDLCTTYEQSSGTTLGNPE